MGDKKQPAAPAGRRPLSPRRGTQAGGAERPRQRRPHKGAAPEPRPRRNGGAARPKGRGRGLKATTETHKTAIERKVAIVGE